MRLTRIYQPQALRSGQIIHLSKAAAGHLLRVLRLTRGAECIIFNGDGGEFTAKIIESTKNSLAVQLGQFNEVSRESPLNIILAQAVLRSEKMDYILQKSVELGVTRFIPLLTAHSTLQLATERWQKRCQHWQGVMLAACEQSGRTARPYLDNPMTFDKALSAVEADKRIILSPQATRNRSLLSPSDRSIAVLVGPEGGWSDHEVKSAAGLGYSPLQLGPRILRAETAGLAALSILQNLQGDM